MNKIIGDIYYRPLLKALKANQKIIVFSKHYKEMERQVIEKIPSITVKDFKKVTLRRNIFDISVAVDIFEFAPRENLQQLLISVIKVAADKAIVVLRNSPELPKPDEFLVLLDKALRKSNKNAKVKSFVDLKIPTMKIFKRIEDSKQNPLSNYVFWVLYLWTLILKKLDIGEDYRRVFVIEFEP